MRTLLAFLFILVIGGVRAEAASLVVQADGIESNEGQVAVGVCDRGLDVSACPFRARRPARAGQMVFNFDGLRPGTYAVVIYHDVNGNGSLDRSGMGLPQEPYGFSNGVGRMSRPTVETAGVQVGNGGKTVSVQVRRLFSTR